MPLTWYDKIVKIEELCVKRYVLGIGKEAEFEDVSTGWWLVLESGIAVQVKDPSEFINRKGVTVTIAGA